MHGGLIVLIHGVHIGTKADEILASRDAFVLSTRFFIGRITTEARSRHQWRGAVGVWFLRVGTEFDQKFHHRKVGVSCR